MNCVCLCWLKKKNSSLLITFRYAALNNILCCIDKSVHSQMFILKYYQKVSISKLGFVPVFFIIPIANLTADHNNFFLLFQEKCKMRLASAINYLDSIVQQMICCRKKCVYFKSFLKVI